MFRRRYVASDEHSCAICEDGSERVSDPAVYLLSHSSIMAIVPSVRVEKCSGVEVDHFETRKLHNH